MADCIFCMLANHDIPTNVVYEDEEMFCFKDMDPQAPVHVLLIPKKHIACLDDLKEEDAPLMGRMMLKIQDIAKDLELENGYRVVSNNGEDAFQSVKHLHFHILGKRKMSWPPG
ncbi:MAG: histidine triad nucleotide-binding protein [Firmicutes bacterium]|nr:histidine triad nucleotide-binding protein [Bacillota bacterium]